VSGIAGIFNVPADPLQLSAWSFNHAVHHVEINAAIRTATGITIPAYVLDPFNPADMELWLYQHQAMHSTMDAILGIKGYDLTTIDWKDPTQLGGWIQGNANEHFQAANILEIG
jgi:hypothetical protein